MREMIACGSAPAGVGTARSKPSTRMRTISPERNGSMWMSVARSSTAFSNRSLTARTTGAPLARSRSEFDIVLALRARRLADLGDGRLVFAEALGQHGRDVLIGRDLDLDGRAKHDLGGADRGGVGRIGERKTEAAAGHLIGKHGGLAQEALRKPRN